MLDHERIESLIDVMVQRLGGDWLLVGGALVALWLEPRRTTEDVDIIGLEGTQSERLRLMELAENEGLPIEAVNSAADYFIRKIPDWRDELEIFRQSGRTRIFRPTPTLFVLLKIHRLSEQDLQDCRRLLERVVDEGLKFDLERVARELDQSAPVSDPEKMERRGRLREILFQIRNSRPRTVGT